MHIVDRRFWAFISEPLNMNSTYKNIIWISEVSLFHTLWNGLHNAHAAETAAAGYKWMEMLLPADRELLLEIPWWQLTWTAVGSSSDWPTSLHVYRQILVCYANVQCTMGPTDVGGTERGCGLGFIHVKYPDFLWHLLIIISSFVLLKINVSYYE